MHASPAAERDRTEPRDAESANPYSRSAAQFGPELLAEGGVRFRLYAPAAETVRLALDEHQPDPPPLIDMQRNDEGWHEAVVSSAAPGTRYRFVLPDDSRVPDTGSRFQPFGVHGPSEIVDPRAFRWTDKEWRGRPWEETVLYELHIGTFTREGTFAAATEKLDHLKAVGVTGIELMCINAFAGQRSWGYDGVLFFAPDATYGRPVDLKAFIDAAHARGIIVIFDVVYNHFGPEGNYIPKYWPGIFSKQHKTAWGPGLNFDGPGNAEVRRFILSNALFWIKEFHADGLRLDASHAMIDDSKRHILNELAHLVHEAAAERQVHLILENEQTIGRLLTRRPDGSVIAYTAQWNHAIDHILGMAMADGCHADRDQALHETNELGRALAEGFVPDANDINCPSPERDLHVPPTAFVSFIQTHDLVGNRVFGERVSSLASTEAVRAIAAVYLLLPQIPMLFMGEEWAASTPFPFFSDFGGELADMVRQGRREQLKKTGQLPHEKNLDAAPDAQAESTFLSAKLNWDELRDALHTAQRDWYARVLAARQTMLVPRLKGLYRSCGHYRILGPGQLAVDWVLEDATLLLAANLCSQPTSGFEFVTEQQVFWLEGSQSDEKTLAPWSVRWALRE